MYQRRRTNRCIKEIESGGSTLDLNILTCLLIFHGRVTTNDNLTTAFAWVRSGLGTNVKNKEGDMKRGKGCKKCNQPVIIHELWVTTTLVLDPVPHNAQACLDFSYLI